MPPPGSSKRPAKPVPAPVPAATLLPDPTPWLSAHRKHILIALAAFSFLIRAAYYIEVRDTPLPFQHLWNQTDMFFFDHWAKVIDTEDPLGRHPQHPYFGWQDGPAKMYFSSHPEQIAEYERAGVPHGDTQALYRALWDRWTHGTEFYQEPLYVYLIALTYKIAGASVRAVFAWQIILGVCTNLIVYLLARRYFGDLAALVAGTLILFYSPLFLYDVILLRTALIAFLAAAAVASLEWSLANGSWRRWAVTGLVIGVAMACQSTFLIFLIGAVIIIGVKLRPSMPAAKAAAVMLLCCALAVSPIIIRNIMVNAPTFSWVGASVWTFVRFNAPSVDPLKGPITPIFPDDVRILADSGARALPAVIGTLREHTLFTFAGLMWGKFQKAWSWYEEGDNISFYFSRIYSAVLRYAPVTNLLIAPLLLAGLVFFLKQWRQYTPMYLLAANGILVLLITFPTDRYRVPYFAVLIPFAAAILVRLYQWISARRTKQAMALAAALLVVFLWTSLPLPASRRLIRVDFYGAPLGYYFMPLHEDAVHRQDWHEAAHVVEQFLRSEPSDLATCNDPLLISAFSSAHATLGHDLQQAGDSLRARQESARGEELAALASALNRH